MALARQRRLGRLCVDAAWLSVLALAVTEIKLASVGTHAAIATAAAAELSSCGMLEQLAVDAGVLDGPDASRGVQGWNQSGDDPPQLCRRRVAPAMTFNGHEGGQTAYGRDSHLPLARIGPNGEDAYPGDPSSSHDVDARWSELNAAWDVGIPPEDTAPPTSAGRGDGTELAPVTLKFGPSWTACQVYASASVSQANTRHCVLHNVRLAPAAEGIDSSQPAWELRGRVHGLSKEVAEAFASHDSDMPLLAHGTGWQTADLIAPGTVAPDSECTEVVRNTTFFLPMTGNAFHAIHDVVMPVFAAAHRARRGGAAAHASGGLALFDAGEPTVPTLRQMRSAMLQAMAGDAPMRSWPSQVVGACFERVVFGQPLVSSLNFPEREESRALWGAFADEMRRSVWTGSLSDVGATITAPHITIIDRRTPGKRELTNIPALVDMASAKGLDVTVHAIEEASFAETAAQLARTTILVGATGAGLTNAIWMPPGACIVLFWPDIHPRLHRHPYFDPWEQIVRSRAAADGSFGALRVVLGNGDFERFSVDASDFGHTLDSLLVEGVHRDMQRSWKSQDRVEAGSGCGCDSGAATHATSVPEPPNTGVESAWARCRVAGHRWTCANAAGAVGSGAPEVDRAGAGDGGEEPLGTSTQVPALVQGGLLALGAAFVFVFYRASLRWGAAAGSAGGRQAARPGSARGSSVTPARQAQQGLSGGDSEDKSRLTPSGLLETEADGAVAAASSTRAASAPAHASPLVRGVSARRTKLTPSGRRR